MAGWTVPGYLGYLQRLSSRLTLCKSLRNNPDRFEFSDKQNASVPNRAAVVSTAISTQVSFGLSLPTSFTHQEVLMPALPYLGGSPNSVRHYRPLSVLPPTAEDPIPAQPPLDIVSLHQSTKRKVLSQSYRGEWIP